MIASSCRIAWARERRVSASKSIGSMPGRRSDSGPSSIRGNLHQRSNQAQQRLMFRSIRFAVQKCRQINMGKPATRWSVRLMNDKGPATSRLARKKPRVPIRAAVQFSSIWHLARPCSCDKHSSASATARARDESARLRALNSNRGTPEPTDPRKSAKKGTSPMVLLADATHIRKHGEEHAET